MNIKKNDTVIVLSGKSKGKKGKVLTAMPKENKLLVEGVNVPTATRRGSMAFTVPDTDA